MNSSEHHLGRAIRALRLAAGKSQQELAVQLRLTTAALSMIETGRNQPTVATLTRIMKLFDVTPNELFSEGKAFWPRSQAGLLQRVDEDVARLTPSVEVVVNRLIECVIGLEELARAPKHGLTPLHVPLELSDSGLETLAERVRQHLRIYDGVVFDYFELLESFGLRVLSLPLRISFPGTCYFDSRNENAFFIMNNRHAPERQLVTMATQLGRLHLHTWATNRGSYPATHKNARLDPAQAAAKFATYFLLPSRAVRMTVSQLGVEPGEWTVELLMRVKHRYGVSADAFLSRLDELDLIDRDLKIKLRTRIKNHFNAVEHGEQDDRRRVMRPNGRLWDLALTASLRLGNRNKELQEILRDLKRMHIASM